MKYTLLLLSILLVVGCASNKGGYRAEAAVEQKLMTMNKDEVLIDLGPPHKKVKIDEERESWRYESEVGGLAGGECTLSILFKGEKVVQAKLSANDLSWVSFPLASCSKIIQTLR
ncbi:MAG: hypothetical protein KDF24_04950 [Rhodocyclaceae bacterium]|nr:hypothetical protein [Rhodocyclaceae bacterium]MCB1962495.1 hypothetical protein [Rhodocyclaceae bacterium]